MSHNSLLISTLSTIVVKPHSWSITRNIDNTYILSFSYLSPDDINFMWLEIRTRRGAVKNYKSIQTVFNDIEKVQADALIYMKF